MELAEKINKIFTQHTKPQPLDAHQVSEMLALGWMNECYEALPIVESVMEQTYGLKTRFQERGYILLPNESRSPKSINQTGGLVAVSYRDIRGRDGLAVALLVPNPYNKDSIKENAVFGLDGYRFNEGSLYMPQNLLYPYYGQSGYMGSPLESVNFTHEDVVNALDFAENVAKRLFSGHATGLYHDIRRGALSPTTPKTAPA